MSVLLANTPHKSRLILGLNRSRVSGEIPTRLPLVSNSIPYPVWVLRDLRVQHHTSNLTCDIDITENLKIQIIFTQNY